ncbi:MAG: suppressor of fused domain protein [Labilithrix sp.]|nr:suppressor of fused domain protein [Labilithrix sp.]MCW5812864.1 suppressor of fused domain protein [Labilithrix sp.]
MSLNGWDSIRAAGRSLYGAQEPRHLASVVGGAFTGRDPLEGIDCYASSSLGAPHWHYLTYGLTELRGKESPNPEVSGWGMELTMRVARGAEGEPPMWPAGLLQNLAQYTYETGRVFEPGALLDVNGPLAEGAATVLTGLVFTDDPELAVTVATNNGAFRFVQVVGLAGDELEAAYAWSPSGALGLLSHVQRNVTDLARPSALASSSAQAALLERIAREGSATEVLRLPALGISQDEGGLVLELGARSLARVARVVAGRLGHGRGLLLRINDSSLELRPGDRVALDEESGVLFVTAPAVASLANVEPRAGKFSLAPGLSVQLHA